MKYLKILFLLFFTPLLVAEIVEKPPVEIECVADLSKEDTSSNKKAEEKTSSPVPEAIHQATESYETAFVKTIIVLVGLLVLIILTVWMLRKINHGRVRGMNALKSVKILEKRPLSPKSILYLIEVSGKQVLIAESQLEVRTVTTLDWLETDKDL